MNNSRSRSFAVVVTADDFGIGRRTSEGIIQAHLHGPVTATSLMTITENHVRDSIPLLQNAPNLDVGLHIVLTQCGHRALTATSSSGLVDRDRHFLPNSHLWIKAFTGKLNKSAVAEEIAAQEELFRKLLGRPPTHVDCHHHAHQLPTIIDALLDLIGGGTLPAVTRTTIEPPGLLRTLSGARAKRLAANFLGSRASPTFARHHIWSNDYFLGMLAPCDLSRTFPWQHFIDQLPPTGVLEWVVHPGLPDSTLNGRDGYQIQRPIELTALTQTPASQSWQHLRPFLTRKSQLCPPSIPT